MTTEDENTEGPDTGTEMVPATAPVPSPDPGPHTALLEPSEDPKAEALRSRLLLPLLTPIVGALAIAFYAVNLSRALLAGGSTGALVIASVVTLLILGGVAWISAAPNLSTGSLSVVLAGLLLLIGASGLTSLGPSEHHEEGGEAAGYQAPVGEPDATLEVDALGTLKFQATSFETTAGIVEIDYVGKGGTHTLVFEEPELRGFKLGVNGKPEDRGKVLLEPGTYTIYCDLPGHRAAGMEATITVTAAAPSTASTSTS